jgi:hypothetical protein
MHPFRADPTIFSTPQLILSTALKTNKLPPQSTLASNDALLFGLWLNVPHFA